MNRYSAYGLAIESDLVLPELRQAAAVGAADAVIRCQPLDWKPPWLDANGGYYAFTPTAAYLHWQAVGTFVIQNGTHVTVDPNPEASEALVRLPLLGVILGVLLQQRGLLVLHASAVAIDRQVVAFLGEKGQGKSTMAATLYRRGHAFLTDDLVVLDFAEQAAPLVRPGFPQMKLWPDAVSSSLGDDPDLFDTVASGIAKRQRPIPDQLPTDALPLAGVFLLRGGSDLRVDRLTEHQALVQLIANTYVARFGDQVLRGPMAATHLRQCAELVRWVPAYTLERPRALHLLPQIAQTVEDCVRGPH